jgi:tetratricopeptide (TPR) repeat protein
VAQAGLAALVIVFLTVSAGAGISDETATTDLAGKAGSENLPQISAAVLRTQILREGDPASRRVLTRRLVALLVAGGRFDEALAVCAAAGGEEKDPVILYWKGVAYLGAGDYASARDLFKALLKDGITPPGILSDQLQLGLARALRGEGKPTDALEVLGGIPSDSPVAEDAVIEKAVDLIALGKTDECNTLLHSLSTTRDGKKATVDYLRAMVLWKSGNPTGAKKILASVPPQILWFGSASTLASALLSKKPAEGIDLLEKSLESSDEPSLMEERFFLLDQLYSAAGTPETTLLKKWSHDESKPDRSRLAAFYLGKGEMRLLRLNNAEETLKSFIGTHPDDPLAGRARLLLASLELELGHPGEAAKWSADIADAPAGIRARLAFLRGLSLASEGRTEEAKPAFQSVAVLDPKLAESAIFNRAMLIAKSDRGKLGRSPEARAIVELGAGIPSREMKLQIALDLARGGDDSGLLELAADPGSGGDPSIGARARLAVAEKKMGEGLPEGEQAKLIRENSGEPERQEYLTVFLKDTGRKSDAPGVIVAARTFLAAHPDSRFAPEVRLKLAEALLSSGDIQGARVEFEQLAASSTGGELGRRALFLAAQSASRAMDPASMDDSMMLLERVASTGSGDQLAWQARLQQGALKNAQNLPLEALAIYQKILTSDASDPELRSAAMMAQADTLHQLGALDPSREREAVKAWDQISKDPSKPLRWRNQALCKSGLVLEKLGDGDAALASYYEAFKNPRDAEPEQLWHDKAAFEAARLLEGCRQWKEAVTLYNLLIEEGGPRSAEAGARVSKLRLENFLWEN